MTIRAWAKELRRRWPALVAILRGNTVIYEAQIGKNGAFISLERSGAVLMDSVIKGTGWSYNGEGSTGVWVNGSA